MLCAAVYLPGLVALPAVDRDEARFAQASRQMFESVALPEAERTAHHAGGLVVPMVQDRPRLNKPPLIYWLQAASAAMFTGVEPRRDAVWMYRVPSTIAAMLSVLMLWRLGLSMFDPRAAFLAAVMLAVCPVFVWEARQARADHVLTACTIGAMWGLWGVWRAPGVEPQRHRGHRGRQEGGGEKGAVNREPKGVRPIAFRRRLRRSGVGWALLLWGSMALGVMTKGPITPMVVVLAAVSLSLLTRRWRWMRGARPVAGAVILAAAVVPWVMLMAERYGMSRYLTLVYDETFGRATAAREKHWGPPGYHLVLLIVMLWPGSMVTGLAVWRAWGRTIAGWRPWKWRARAGAGGVGGTVAPGRDAERGGAEGCRTRGSRRGDAEGRGGRPGSSEGSWDRANASGGVRSRSAELFCLAWVLPAWVVFELSATKLPHYVMPVFPALALLSARTLLAASAGSVGAAFGRLATSVYVLWLGVCAIGGVGIVAGSLLVFDGSWRGPIWVAAGFAGAALVVQVWLLVRACGSVVKRKPARAMRSGVWMAVALWVVAIGVAVPRAPSLWVSSAAARQLRAIDPSGQRAVGLLFQEDSMIFETRGRGVRLGSVDEVAAFFAEQPDGLVVMRQSDLEGRGELRVLGFVSGFNVARAGRERLAIVESAERGEGRESASEGAGTQ